MSFEDAVHEQSYESDLFTRSKSHCGLGKSKEQLQVSKGKTWSHGTNSCFAIVPLT